MHLGPLVTKTSYTDELAAQRGSALRGGELLATSGGAATATIRDGLDSDGRILYTFVAAVSAYDRQVFPEPLPAHEGLYVDHGSNVSHFILYYHPPLED